jgi:nucleotide-binding universal stress UspA family protein
MYQRIFWPVDPLSPAPLPLDVVRALLPSEGGTLRAVSVIEPLQQPDLFADFADPEMLQLLKVRQTDLRASLRRNVHAAVHAGIEVETAVHEGSPLQTLLADLRGSGADLLLIRTRGVDENGKRIGGLTFDLLLRSQVPVCCVRDVREKFKVERVLVGTDFSERAVQALDIAIELAERHNASIRLTHLVSRRGVDIAGRARDALHTTAREAFDAWIEANPRVGGSKVVIEEEIGEAEHPHEGLISAARSFDADLVVVASHGWSGMPGLFVGSTARKVVRSCEIPVLVVRGADNHDATR